VRRHPRITGKPIWLSLSLIVLLAAIAGTGFIFGVKGAANTAGTATVATPPHSVSVSTANSAPPASPTSGLSSAIALSAGYWHTCALLADGGVKCWGDNQYGELGDGNLTWSGTPVSVNGIKNATTISVGQYHTCALLADRSVKCWGANHFGQLGDGTTTDRTTPVSVGGVSDAIAVSAGWANSCALLAGGSVKCWGDDEAGQLGDGTTTQPWAGPRTPTTVSGISDATAISAGSFDTCALLADGSVKCWGANAHGELGDGTTTERTTPVSVSGITRAVVISSGGDHTCALLSDGGAECWGDNYNGQLGDGTSFDTHTTPVSVNGLSGALAISAGGAHTCALLADGRMKCWGWNLYGQLGDGLTPNGSSTPVAVRGITGAIAIAAGNQHACAVLSDGSVKCWGDNGVGQLGDGTEKESDTPVSVSGF